MVSNVKLETFSLPLLKKIEMFSQCRIRLKLILCFSGHSFFIWSRNWEQIIVREMFHKPPL